MFYVTESFHKAHPNSQLHAGDVVVVQSGAVGECAVVNKEFDGGNCHALIIMSPRKTTDPIWFSNILNSPLRRNLLAGITTGNTIHHILASDMKKISVPTPPYDEQRKISKILIVQDTIIELKEKLLAEKQHQKKYLMQQLLTGKKRLPGFYDEWCKVRLYSIVRRIIRKNEMQSDNVLTISAQHGLTSQTEFFKKTVASDDKSNYYLLYRDDFAYNKSYSNGYPYGAIKRLTKHDMGIVSPLYICFQVRNENVSIDYIEQFFEAGLMNHEIQAFAQEGARNHGLLNIATNDFFNANIMLPSIEEQKAIAKILITADQEIELLQKNIQQEKQKKKALMQLLLTGIVRVNL